MVARIICIAMLVAVANAATWIARQPMKPLEFAHKQGCYIKELDDVIPYGEAVAVVGQCYRVECSRHMIYFSSCSAVATEDPKCYVTDYDVSRPYPDCCPDVKCEFDNRI